ncbi:MAG: hypothetical protein BWY65_00889 [Firmicutes bacterium ADurb.Bin373]|nr:MAG: hypothetical protein BWY65_00889 [Firmicutes bacterium ADurb.Bin373]
MISLLKKDLLIQKKSFLFLFLYGIFMFIVFNNPVFEDMIYIMGMIIAVYFFLVTASMEDDKNKSEIILNSLPLSKSQIVLAKYLSVFAYILIGAVLLGVVGLLFQLAAFSLTPRLINAVDLLAAGMLVSICVSVYFPLYFRFGASALRLFSVVFFLIFFFMPRYLLDLYRTYEGTEAVRLLNKFFIEQSPFVPAAAVIFIILMLMTGSFLISRYIYLRKEF